MTHAKFLGADRPLAPGMVVQIDPASDEVFGGCFLTVTEVKSWGVQGYVNVPGKKGVAYYRPLLSSIKPVGFAEWVVESLREEAGEGAAG